MNVLSAAIREQVRALDPDLPVQNLRTMAESLWLGSWRLHLLRTVLLAGALLALFVSAVGTAAVVAQTVRGRLRELAIRLALGARTSELGLVAVSSTLPVALLGVAVGIGGGMALGRQLRALLFEVGPADPLSLLAGCLVVAATVALTAALAVRRVAELEPANVLRREWDS